MVSILTNPSPATWPALCKRAEFDDSVIEARVRAILQRVRADGDNALRAITEEIDGACPNEFLVSETEFERASSLVSNELKEAIIQAEGNIERFHKAELPSSFKVETMPGVSCQRRWLPISRVGLYIPGGSAPLFSTILMLAIPARLAGCPEVILCTPCNKAGEVNPVVLWTARLCGIETVYKLGGAQAIGAMAYGTESICPVNKIFGPGNRYVTKAKQMVSTEGTAIDMPAGPSEIMVLADETASPDFIAADMLSQAEHGPDSQAMVVCPNMEMAKSINDELERQLALLPRAPVADKALSNSRIIVFNTPDEAARRDLFISFANAYASEHLLIETRDPWQIAHRITAAGSIFIGHHSPESAGDYASGTNHTLPTMGYAKAYNGIGVDSFMHAITYQELSAEGLECLSQAIILMAEAEGLDAHANAVKVRVKK
ncbi:MAG: histidinol dehydrogenase [Bacteroidaceae bacterium]|nr:histidinol dehydrogenase [Bacteroidaceae bacterium]